MFVDDDPMLLSSTRRQLFTKLPECELVFCGSGAEALQNIASAVPDIVFSDVRMPEMDGAELLLRIAGEHPETVRLGWTGHSEVSQLRDVLKVAHQVLGKPCPTETLQEIIQAIAGYRQPLRKSWLFKKITDVGQHRFDLTRLRNLLGELDNPDRTAWDIAEQVDRTQGIRARLLAFANSPFFAPSVPISRTIEAITMVGFNMVKAIFVSNELADMADGSAAVKRTVQACLDGATNAVFRMQSQAIWNRLDESDRNRALLAAIFHQFGRVQFSVYGGDDYTRLQLLASRTEGNLDQLEQEYFGVQHQQVAAYLLRVWGMETATCQVIALGGKHSEDANEIQQMFQLAIDAGSIVT